VLIDDLRHSARTTSLGVRLSKGVSLQQAAERALVDRLTGVQRCCSCGGYAAVSRLYTTSESMLDDQPVSPPGTSSSNMMGRTGHSRGNSGSGADGARPFEPDPLYDQNRCDALCYVSRHIPNYRICRRVRVLMSDCFTMITK